ncbi:MAG: HAD family hydrolase [Sumerlaeia bacterium]
MLLLKRPIKWIFFDVGGTLFDDEPVYQFQEDLIFDLLADHGIDVSPEEFAKTVKTARALYLPKYPNHLIWSFTEDMERYGQVWAAYEERMEAIENEPDFRELITPLPGIKDLLLDLRQHYNLAIVGNQPQVVRQCLQEHHMLPLFDVHAISAEMGLRKPDFRFYLAVLAMAHCQPSETVMVGDRVDNDIFPARALGMTTVLLKVGPHRKQPVLSPEYLPHYTCESVHQLCKLLISEPTG